MDVTDPILQVRGLSAGYGPLRVLHEIDLSLQAGERVGLVGLNGHGKTTLIRALCHMAGWQQGSIRFGGREIGGTRNIGAGRRTAAITRLGMGVAPQGDAIFPGLSVRQHLACGAWSPRAWRERERRIEKIFDTFAPLRPLEHALVGQLSGGERRMVSLGRMLMTRARLCLIDEPSIGLAPKIAATVMQAIDALPRAEVTLLIAEQNVSLLSGVVDRTLGMHAGRLRGDVGHVALG